MLKVDFEYIAMGNVLSSSISSEYLQFVRNPCADNLKKLLDVPSFDFRGAIIDYVYYRRCVDIMYLSMSSEQQTDNRHIYNEVMRMINLDRGVMSRLCSPSEKEPVHKFLLACIAYIKNCII